MVFAKNFIRMLLIHPKVGSSIMGINNGKHAHIDIVAADFLSEIRNRRKLIRAERIIRNLHRLIYDRRQPREVMECGFLECKHKISLASGAAKIIIGVTEANETFRLIAIEVLFARFQMNMDVAPAVIIISG